MTPIARTVPVPLATRAEAYGLVAVTVDGTDVRAVRDAVAAVSASVRSGDGPAFVEIAVPRIRGHYNADVEHYREASDRDDAASRDPLTHSRAQLLGLGLDPAELVAREASIEADVDAAVQAALASPTPDTSTAHDHVVSVVAPTIPADPAGDRALTYGAAVNEALRSSLAERPEMLLYGEDVAVPGGVFGVTRGLQKEFGQGRVFDTPISESAILGSAVGASIRGARPVVEIMWADFLLVALDQLVNQAANVRYLSNGAQCAPLVVRTQQGVTPGSCAQHSQSLEALLAHVPGLKVGLPSTAHDAYMMTRAAIADDDPVVLIESRALYLEKDVVDVEARPEKVGGARLRRAGRDVLLISWGRMVHECDAAADLLAAQGIRAGVLDLRWLAPLDFGTVKEQAVAHGGKVVVVHEANRTGGFGAELAARLNEDAFEQLDGPVVRVAAPDVRWPAAPSLQAALLPESKSIARAAAALCEY
jgi:2-oxoisovalerate dehydrogenase E1 component